MLKFSLHICIIFFMIFGFTVKVSSQEMCDSTIVNHIEQDSGAQVKIYQPNELLKRLKPQEAKSDEATEHKSTGTMHKTVGFRVQVFSDNNHRTAKSEALVKERNIISRFPQINSYLSYKPPFWRLRVGDFRTREEAAEMMQQIKKEFPGYAREIIIVQDRVNVLL